MHRTDRLNTTHRVNLIGAIVNLLLALIKILVGMLSHSAALLADGVHSLSDLLSNALVYFAAKFGQRCPDPEHPYGHHRIETIATIIIAILLVAVGFGIIYDSTQHVISNTATVIHGLPAIVVALISILANEGLFHYTLRIGKRIHSNLLITNAWHNRSDALVSVIVLLSVLGSLLKFPYLDAIGAAVIALLILKTALSMIYRSFSELIDTSVDPKMLAQIRTHIKAVTGVNDIHMLRTRMHAGNIFVDVHILVDPKISVSEGHYISDQVYKMLSDTFEQISDITVHIDPEDDEKNMPSVNSPNRADVEFRLRERWKSLPIYHDIKRVLIHYLDGKLQIEVFIPEQSVASLNSHDVLTQLRNAARDIHEIEKIELHLTI